MTDSTGAAVPEEGNDGGLGLEGSLRRLEEILAKLESQDLELGAALELFQEGVEHIRRAEGLLAKAELQVEELLGDGETGQTRPFPGTGDAGAGCPGSRPVSSAASWARGAPSPSNFHRVWRPLSALLHKPCLIPRSQNPLFSLSTMTRRCAIRSSG